MLLGMEIRMKHGLKKAALFLAAAAGCMALMLPVVSKETRVEAKLVLIEPGDVNEDGRVNASDALLVLQVAAKIIDVNKDEMNMSIWDLNSDGIVNAEDALKILKIAAKIE